MEYGCSVHTCDARDGQRDNRWPARSRGWCPYDPFIVGGNSDCAIFLLVSGSALGHSHVDRWTAIKQEGGTDKQMRMSFKQILCIWRQDLL